MPVLGPNDFRCEPNMYNVPVTDTGALPGQELLRDCDPLTKKIMLAGLSAVAFASQGDLRIDSSRILGDGTHSAIDEQHSEAFRRARRGLDYLAAAGASVVALAHAASNVLRSPHPARIDRVQIDEITETSYPVRRIILPVNDPHLQELTNVQLGASHPVTAVQIAMSGVTKGSETLQLATVGGNPNALGPTSNYFTIFTDAGRPGGSRYGNRVTVSLEAGANMGVFGAHRGASFPTLAKFALFMSQFAAGGEAAVREAAG